ncbi:hypothetical protein AB0B45_44370 [Nonomuraea sp. NPDC049152]|uniref:hypothetical protein n=1 Tax=Nonomuraea sp. NPDC049152 TaxID=3154350 RepID=UPI0033DC1EDE
MDHHLFQVRLQTGALTIWELGDLLGIHPHLLHTMQLEYLAELPVKTVIELARRLDMHPADIVADLDSVLDNPRDLEPHMPRQQSGELADDAQALLGALAHAAVPLLIDDVATALQWDLQRVYAALGHARAHPELAGPYTIERIPPETYALRPRLDLLSRAQQQAIHSVADYHQPLTEAEATMLLSVIWCGRSPEYAAFRAQHLGLERELRLCGLIRDKGVPTKAEASADVQYSLRLTRGDHLIDPDRPFAEPPWWRRPRLDDGQHLEEQLYGGSEVDGDSWDPSPPDLAWLDEQPPAGDHSA